MLNIAQYVGLISQISWPWINQQICFSFSFNWLFVNFWEYIKYYVRLYILWPIFNPPLTAPETYIARLSLLLSVHLCVQDYMFPQYLQYLLMDFHQTFVIGASWDKDELIKFWGQRSRSHIGSTSTRPCCRVKLSNFENKTDETIPTGSRLFFSERVVNLWNNLDDHWSVSDRDSLEPLAAAISRRKPP